MSSVFQIFAQGRAGVRYCINLIFLYLDYCFLSQFLTKIQFFNQERLLRSKSLQNIFNLIFRLKYFFFIQIPQRSRQSGTDVMIKKIFCLKIGGKLAFFL
jgi:hypothetical protein